MNKLFAISGTNTSFVNNVVYGTVTVSGTNDKYDLVQYTNNLVTITNITGAELPSTGGMGTTLFVVIGSLLAIASAVIFVTNKRIAKEMKKRERQKRRWEADAKKLADA